MQKPSTQPVFFFFYVSENLKHQADLNMEELVTGNQKDHRNEGTSYSMKRAAWKKI